MKHANEAKNEMAECASDFPWESVGPLLCCKGHSRELA